MEKEEKITKLGQIDGISIYYDRNQKKSEVLLGYKSESIVEEGYVWVDTKAFNEALLNAKSAPIEKDEVDKILKESVERSKYEDIEFVIGSSKNLEFYKKFLKKLKQLKTGEKKVPDVK